MFDVNNLRSAAVRCPKCGYVYWTRAYENWASCSNCGSNNDQIPYHAKVKPQLVDSKHIFQTIPYEPVPSDKSQTPAPKEPRPFNRYTALMKG